MAIAFRVVSEAVDKDEGGGRLRGVGKKSEPRESQPTGRLVSGREFAQILKEGKWCAIQDLNL